MPSAPVGHLADTRPTIMKDAFIIIAATRDPKAEADGFISMAESKECSKIYVV